MKKKPLLISLSLLLTLIPFGNLRAQDAPPSPYQIKSDLEKLPEAERVKAMKEFKLKHPLLVQRKDFIPRKTDFPEASRGIITIPTKKKNSTPLMTNDASNVTLWANLANCSDWGEFNYQYGYYSLHPTDPVSPSLLYEYPSLEIAKNGVQYANGHIYGITIDFTYAVWGYIYEFLYDTDTSTGQTTMNTLNSSTDMGLAGVETAQAEDGTVYGEFYNSDATAYEWGTVDYATRKHTVIAPATHTYVALGITSVGQLYGVATDGNLYKIDKSNGSETLVGATGLSLTASDGTFYAQSGEIDQTDDTFYWAATDANGNNGLYKVNLETGTATKISDYNYQLYGMMIAPQPTSSDAPAEATEGSLNFDGTSLNGTLTFKAPTHTFNGDTLTGNINYTIKQNSQTVASGTTTAGDIVITNVSVPTSGDYKFVVTTSNSEGESPKTVLEKWIGFDVPRPVTDISIKNNNNNVSITWTAPTKGIHDGALGDLTYDVYRIINGDSTNIASNIPDTSFVDNLDGTSLGYYAYAIKAKANGLESAFATSTGIAVGSAIEPDWTDEFNDNNDFKLYTTLDANQDGYKWSYGDKYAQSTGTYMGNNDDWLFTPPIHLAPGYLYRVSFKVRNASLNSNTLEVKWGDDTIPQAMDNTLLETTTPSFDWQVKSYEINVQKDGKYYIGFHDNTPYRNSWYIYIDSIVVEKSKGTFGTAPLAVNDLHITPASKGALQATLTFKVPLKSVDGNYIDKVDSIQIKRDGEEIAALTNKAAGENISFVDDNVPADGNHTYLITPFLNGNFGKSSTISSFIGRDVPETAKNTILMDNTNNILALWDTFSDKGPNNGYVDGGQVAVSFYKLIATMNGYALGDYLTTSNPGETRVTIPMNPEETTASDGKTQTLLQLATQASYEDYNSEYAFTYPMIIGPSIKLPYKESFAAGKIENGFAWIEGNEQYNNNNTASAWQINEDYSGDADGGSAMWHDYTTFTINGPVDYSITAGDEVSINTPKITLNGAANPMLYFNLFARAGQQAKLKVQAQTPDGINHDLETYDLSTTQQDGWTTKGIDLSKYISERYIVLRFWGIANENDVELGIDNINVFDQLEDNLKAVDIHVPYSVRAGKTGKADVYVKNFGAHPAKNYSVVLYADNEPVDTVNVNGGLQIIDKDTVSLSFPVAINRTENINLRAEVIDPNDMDEDDNNTETKSVRILPSEYAKVNTLEATTGDNGVELNWESPINPAPEEVTEDFESYDPFSTDFGDWTTYDGDKALATSLFSSYSYPGQGTAFAYDVFNPNAITDQFNVVEHNPGLAPHSGNQYAGSPSTRNANGTYADADDWLISPELSGKKQTISFYALNLRSTRRAYFETFDILYSKTNTDIDSFIQLESDEADGNNIVTSGVNWKYFTVELPDSAKYFAIRHTTTGFNQYLFGIDDVTYTRTVPGANDSIIGFNIYRDGNLIGTVKGNEVTFNDNEALDGQHVYNVTVLYQNSDGNINESGFSNDATIDVVTGIANIFANKQGKFNVYTVDGKTIMLNSKSLEGLKPGVYIINDKKYVIK